MVGRLSVAAVWSGPSIEGLAWRNDQAVADISLVGSEAKIRDDLAQWEDAGVTMLVIGAGSIADMRQVAEVILG